MSLDTLGSESSPTQPPTQPPPPPPILTSIISDIYVTNNIPKREQTKTYCIVIDKSVIERIKFFVDEF